jgi:hypothetical protein
MQPQHQERHTNDCGTFLPENEILLQQAVEKLVLFGQQVGVSPKAMILLLDSGISVPDLLAVLETRASEPNK